MAELPPLYPTMHRSCGVMTFIARQSGRVIEKGLGQNTTNIDGAMTDYHAKESRTAAE
jgi:hypothetical protein